MPSTRVKPLKWLTSLSRIQNKEKRKQITKKKDYNKQKEWHRHEALNQDGFQGIGYKEN